MPDAVRPVDVICVCSASGEIKPLRLQVEEEEGFLRGDIEEIVSVKQVPYVGAESYLYTCVVRLGSRRQLVELRYRIRTHKWTLVRVVC